MEMPERATLSVFFFFSLLLITLTGCVYCTSKWGKCLEFTVKDTCKGGHLEEFNFPDRRHRWMDGQTDKTQTLFFWFPQTSVRFNFTLSVKMRFLVICHQGKVEKTFEELSVRLVHCRLPFSVIRLDASAPRGWDSAISKAFFKHCSH